MSEQLTSTTSIQPAKHIYALLVGIDAYLAPVSPLNGCVNDINALEDYLKEWIDPKGDRLHVRKLTNQDATRKNIIDGFRHHLSQAGEEDVVLFAYSGHGSQERANPAFWHLEPDRLNETLVCYDSRFTDNWDLADKELNHLIAELGKRCPHIVAILDCCHSGSGLRETATIRRTTTDHRERPLDSYIFSLDTLSQVTSPRPESSPSGWYLSGAKYILLAACRDSETAKEFPIDGRSRGAFSYFLLDTLQQANGSLTYRDLFRRATALVGSKVRTQSPQLETSDQASLNQYFLGGGIEPHPFYFILKQDRAKGWMIDGGAIHHIPLPREQETTTLAIFPFNSSFEQLRDPQSVIARARVTQVFPHSSQIEFIGDRLPQGEVFKAVVTYLPLPLTGIYVEGDEEGINRLDEGLQASAAVRASLYVHRVDQRSEAKLRVIAKQGRYLITGSDSDRPLTVAIHGYELQHARQVVAYLEHITRWMNTLDLSHPATSQIAPDAIQMQLFDQEEQEVQTPHFEYQKNQQGAWIETPFKLKLTNTSSQKLYCCVLSLSEQYGIDVLFDAGGVWLEPDQETWALGGNLLYPQVPREWWERDGITKTKDVLKLIVSTSEFDARLLVQDELDPFHPEKDLSDTRGIQDKTVRGDLQGMLNHLMNRIQWRRISPQPENAPIEDWTTSQIDITITRPHDAKVVPVESETDRIPEVVGHVEPLASENDQTPKVIGRVELIGNENDQTPEVIGCVEPLASENDQTPEVIECADLIANENDRTPKVIGRDEPEDSSAAVDSVSLGFGVAIQTHPKFQSQARLITVSQATDLGNCLYPPSWRDDPDAVEIFEFTESRGSDPGLSILELNPVSADAIEAVTTETPLRIIIDRHLKENGALVPIAFDGENFLVLGRSIQTAEDRTEVLLERLPPPLNQQHRSAEGMIRILFQLSNSDVFPNTQILESQCEGKNRIGHLH